MSVIALSVAGLTTRAALIAGLAVAALLFTGWRKPARAEPRSHRGHPVAGRPVPRSRQGIVVEHHDAPLYRRPGPARRTVAAALSGGIGMLVGTLTAIVLAFGVAFSVIWLTNMLKQ